MREYTYMELKTLMKGREYPYQNTKAKIQYIDKRLCKRTCCNVMLIVPITMGLTKPVCCTITIDDLRKVYYGEKTFDDFIL